MNTNQARSASFIILSVLLTVYYVALPGCSRQEPPVIVTDGPTPSDAQKAEVVNPNGKAPSGADVKAGNPTEGGDTQFTQDELDALEKNLRADRNYQWKVLQGDHKRTVALILAAQKRKPTSTDLWAGLLEMIFASEQFEARQLPEEERRDRYRYALGYLLSFSQSVESAIKADPKSEALKFPVDSLNGSIALAALESGELATAKRLGEEMLRTNTNAKLWNYGNIIYNANAILGRVALRQNDIEAAKMFLLASGKTPGSPQLNSFGPDFVLDRELLEKGEKAVVLEHLELVGKFWGKTKELAQWKKEIEEGKIPSDPTKWGGGVRDAAGKPTAVAPKPTGEVTRHELVLQPQEFSCPRCRAV